MPEVQDPTTKARAFLAGARLPFSEVDSLWRALKRSDELSLARLVLERIRTVSGALLDETPRKSEIRRNLRQQEALLTSKDQELGAAQRHDSALKILAGDFDLDGEDFAKDGETLGIAGGIYKRRWADLGQREDLRRSATFYRRGALCELGEDAYSQINSAFVEDLLASLGDDAPERTERARSLRERILAELPVLSSWFNTATRAEALFGSRRYAEATRVVAESGSKPAPWELETTARQLAALAHLHHKDPLEVPEIVEFFETLLPGCRGGIRSALVGKVGLALSGGGFRASFYHLGVLARLAELDVLRHVEVISCVSGGSIVGACYWLALRRRMLKDPPMQRIDYIQVVHEVIRHFMEAVATNLRGGAQERRLKLIWRMLQGAQGALDPERAAEALDKYFYRPLMGSSSPIFMHDLLFEPADHSKDLTGSDKFQFGKHNWLRNNKVPMLVLNATTVNSGHAWQFTPMWMGESPWTIHEAADSIPRFEWSWYQQKAGWQMELGRAVAASASVPGIFEPLKLRSSHYNGYEIQLADGGVHDNQGTGALLALNCNVLLVSDACGQLMMEPNPGTLLLPLHLKRSMDTLMERVRLASYGDLAARKMTGLVRGLMFLHMKAGLDADPIRLLFSQESYQLAREQLSPAGVRKEFQKALAELRTDLDVFTDTESFALMACGYQMTKWAWQRDLSELEELQAVPREIKAEWPFDEMLAEITSTAGTTDLRAERLAELARGSQLTL